MDLFIDPASDRGLSAQLYQQIRDGIAAGRLRPGDQLLPSRHVAQQLGLSRHTVTTAYGRLAAEGFTQGRAGGGSVVAGLPGTRAGAGPAARGYHARPPFRRLGTRAGAAHRAGVPVRPAGGHTRRRPFPRRCVAPPGQCGERGHGRIAAGR